jgi:hypothetical protein
MLETPDNQSLSMRTHHIKKTANLWKLLQNCAPAELDSTWFRS